MTLEEYTNNIAIPHRQALLNHEDVEQIFVDADVTCHTTGCIGDNVTRRILLAENADGVYRVSCGTCETDGINNRINDIVLWGYQGVQFTT